MEAASIANTVHQRLISDLIKPMDTFLRSFHSSLYANSANLTSELFVSFLSAADRLNHQTSHNLACVLLEHSLEPEVRGASEGTLIRLIRNRCFESLDRILEQYTAYLSQLRVDLRPAVNGLADSRLRDALTGIQMPSLEGVKRYKLPTASREAALLLILEYVRHLQSVPDHLLDYAVRRLGSADLNQEEQGRILTTIRTALEEPFAKLLGFIENMDIIKRKRWEQDYLAESIVINAAASASSMSMAKRKSGAGSLFIALLFVFPIWYVSETGILNLYAICTAAACATIAIVFFVRGIVAMAADT